VASIALLAACAATAASASAVAPAAVRERTAATPGWRIARVFPNAAFDGLTALGPRNAWLAGASCANAACDRGSVVVRHWDGNAWRVVTPPKAFLANALVQNAGPVAATSASNAWVFADLFNGDSIYTDALHSTGRGWAAPVRLNTLIDAAVAFSPANVWAFGPDGYIGHFNGKTWSHRLLPTGGAAAGATSASDIWIGGLTSAGKPGIEHWNGQAWQATPLPNLGIGGGDPSQDPFFQGIAAITPRDAWADISVLGVVGTTYLLHWNGTKWSRVAFPFAGFANTPVVTDGHGGLWLSIDTGPAPRTSLWFCHYSNGHWTKTPVPRYAGQQPTVDYLAWIPGTGSVWGTGGLIVSQTGGEALLKYGQ
jgi:hypothetical protein